MAQGKTSFILYADLLHTVSKLPDDQAGKLFKTILQYVNDQDPQVEDLLLSVVFEPIKQQLKRDLKEWEQKKAQRSIAGAKGGQASASKRKQNQANVEIVDEGQANQAVNVNDNVTVNVNVNDTVNDNVTVNENINVVVEEEFIQLRQQVIETMKRATHPQWHENEYIEQAGQLLLKYPGKHPSKIIGLINTWCNNYKPKNGNKSIHQQRPQDQW